MLPLVLGYGYSQVDRVIPHNTGYVLAGICSAVSILRDQQPWWKYALY